MSDFDIYVLPPGYKYFGGQIYQLVKGTWVPAREAAKDE